MPRRYRAAVLFPLPELVWHWVRHHYGDPAEFPARSLENAIMARGLTRTQRPVPLAKAQVAARALAPTVPWMASTRPRYLTVRAMRQLSEAVRAAFRADLLSKALPRVTDGGLDSFLWEYCRANGIHPRHYYAVRQRFYRARRDAAEKGVKTGLFRAAPKSAGKAKDGTGKAKNETDTQTRKTGKQ